MTGETRLERVVLLMDFSTQLDAAVDIGQVQGGFVMTLGTFSLKKRSGMRKERNSSAAPENTWCQRLATSP